MKFKNSYIFLLAFSLDCSLGASQIIPMQQETSSHSPSRWNSSELCEWLVKNAPELELYIDKIQKFGVTLDALFDTSSQNSDLTRTVIEACGMDETADQAFRRELTLLKDIERLMQQGFSVQEIQAKLEQIRKRHCWRAIRHHSISTTSSSSASSSASSPSISPRTSILSSQQQSPRIDQDEKKS